MKRTPFQDPGTVAGSFTYYPASPTWWTEWLSWWLIRMIDLMKVQGFEISQPEETEYDSFNTNLSTWYSDLTSWWDSAVAARDLENPIPAFPSLPAIPVDGGIQGVLGVLMQVANIATLLTRLRKDLDSTTDAGEVASILSALKEEVVNLRELFEVTPDSGEAVLKTALLNAADNPLIEALAAVGLHLTVEPQGVHAHYSDEV